eukprot:4615093-Alexandrium_andersonii.AAC.1
MAHGGNWARAQSDLVKTVLAHRARSEYHNLKLGRSSKRTRIGTTQNVGMCARQPGNDTEGVYWGCHARRTSAWHRAESGLVRKSCSGRRRGRLL